MRPAVRRRIRFALRVSGCLLVGGFLVRQLWQTRHGVVADLRTVGLGRFLAAEALALAGTVPGMLSWRVLLADLGTGLDLRTAARLYYVAGLAKYLPGGLWPAVAHAGLAGRLRQPRARLAGAFLGSVALSIVGAGVVGMLAVPRLVGAHPVWWVLPAGLASGLLLIAVRPLLDTTTVVGWRVLRRRGPVPSVPRLRTLVKVIALAAAGWFVSGLHAVVLIDAFDPVSPGAIGTVIGGFALSMVAGIAAVVMPAGLGAREIVLGLTLAGLASRDELVAVVSLSRVLITLADCLAGAAVGATMLAGRTDGRPVLDGGPTGNGGRCDRYAGQEGDPAVDNEASARRRA